MLAFYVINQDLYYMLFKTKVALNKCSLDWNRVTLCKMYLLFKCSVTRICHTNLPLKLYRTFNDRTPTQDWLNTNENIILGLRQTKFSINKSCRLKVGMNALSNRFNYLNEKIDLNWLNLSYKSFKIKCKRLFLS